MTPDLGSMGALAVYLVLAGLVFVESGLLVGFLLPGDTVLFGAGLLAGDEGRLSLPVLLAVVLAAAVAGDAVGYASGRRLGRPWLERRAARGHGDGRGLARAEAFFARWGWWSVVVARWIPWVRTFTPILAGAARMPYPRFLAANVVGALSWGGLLLVLGYAAAGDPRIRTAALVVAAASVTGSVVVGAVMRLRRR
ncbi:membrane-associated protein [Motilibacter peucedani]|uniref:Membrane-associated protein n=1 Tax=Motilibacter peucedani TaxID=598650 RepID=A0A420XUN1_9ACTN|nr:DedA family protein [Motilibacter peucedani]RKS80546.1 membrane-associated protein [Motilibacter peucedani]